MNNQAFEELRNAKYPVKVSFDEGDGVYVTEFLDLPGCSAYGDTVEESYRKAEEAKAEWMRLSLEQGLSIPRPSKKPSDLKALTKREGLSQSADTCS